MERPNFHDAEILLKLYDLRRESELRKARDWVTTQFRPTSAGQVLLILRDTGSGHNRWLRQFISYYEMVASLVHRGILDLDLMEDSVTEHIGFYALMKPFLPEIRDLMGRPEFLRSIERLVEESPRACERVAWIEKWLAEGHHAHAHAHAHAREH